MDGDTSNDETSVTSASSIMDQEIHSIPEDVLFDLEEDILAEIDDFIKSNLELYSNPDFEEQIADYVANSIYIATVESNLCDNTEANH